MSLHDIWKNNPQQLQEKRVDQIISFAGDGRLADSSDTPLEFRDFIARIPLSLLNQYAQQCLSFPFKDSGFALQDIVNEMGVRLGFHVQWGRYRGVKNQIGFDGLWTSRDNHTLIIEVRTTDVYRLSLETIAKYRRKLMDSGKISERRSSILIVVGREDTGELEAQIRGSPFAWDIRLISIDALIRLVKVRNGVDNPALEFRILSILIPREYTRIDGIVDLVFSTTEEVLWDVSSDILFYGEEPVESLEMVSFNLDTSPNSLTHMCVLRMESHFGVHLTQCSKVVFKDLDSGLVVCCLVSKGRAKSMGGYSFSFRILEDTLLRLSHWPVAYCGLGCGFVHQIALVPLECLLAHKGCLEKFEGPQGLIYWKIRVVQRENKWFLINSKTSETLDISENMLGEPLEEKKYLEFTLD